MFYCYNAIKCFWGHIAYIFSIKLIHKSCIKCIKPKSNSFDLRIAAMVVRWYTAYHISSTLEYIKCASTYSKCANASNTSLDAWKKDEMIQSFSYGIISIFKTLLQMPQLLVIFTNSHEILTIQFKMFSRITLWFSFLKGNLHFLVFLLNRHIQTSTQLLMKCQHT